MGEQLIEWNDANVAKLKDMWLVAGLSASEIAIAFGLDASNRSAIVAKAWRMGWKKQETAMPPRPGNNKRLPNNYNPKRHLVPALTEVKPGQEPAKIDIPFTEGGGIPFLQLKQNRCTWATQLNDRGVMTHCCGDEVLLGTSLSFCGRHMQLAVTPARRMRF